MPKGPWREGHSDVMIVVVLRPIRELELGGFASQLGRSSYYKTGQDGELRWTPATAKQPLVCRWLNSKNNHVDAISSAFVRLNLGMGRVRSVR